MKLQNTYLTKNGGLAMASCAVGLALCASVLVWATSVSAGNTTYQYDSLGRVVKVTYPDTKQICYSYDAAGNRTQVKRQATGTCTPPSLTLTSSMTVEAMFAANTANEVESVSGASESPPSSEAQ